MYANLLTGVCRSEELLRQFTFAAALGRRCGVKVDSMMISDVPGLTWGVVPAAVQNGVKYISDGPNASPLTMQGDRIGYVRVQWEHKPFYWLVAVGPRQGALLGAAQGGYSIGHGFKSITVALPYLLRRLERVNYPYDIVQMRWSKGDNGPPDERVMDLVREWNAKHAYPRLIIATTSEMFHAFEQRYGDKLPTYRGDFTPYWEDGTASAARETGMNRHSADRFSQAETIWARESDSRIRPRCRFRGRMEERRPVERAHLGRLQQRQPARTAFRQDTVEVQAGLRPGCRAASSKNCWKRPSHCQLAPCRPRRLGRNRE